VLGVALAVAVVIGGLAGVLFWQPALSAHGDPAAAGGGAADRGGEVDIYVMTRRTIGHPLSR